MSEYNETRKMLIIKAKNSRELINLCLGYKCGGNNFFESMPNVGSACCKSCDSYLYEDKKFVYCRERKKE